MTLFDLINKGIPADEIYNCYCQTQNHQSFEMAAKHLYRVFFDYLVRLRESVQSKQGW